MSKTDTIFCRICLTTNERDNISDSSSYFHYFIQLVTAKVCKDKFRLCMWCKTTLKKTILMKKLALQSDKILNDQNQILRDITHKNILYNFTYTNITHSDIPPTSMNDKDGPLVNLNVDPNEKENEINAVYIQSEFMDEIGTDNKLTNENEFKINEVEIKQFFPTDFIGVNEIENKIKIENDIEMSSKDNKRRLKLAELKFEVKYLNLEEQINEIEIKKMKYKNMQYLCELCGTGFLTNDYYEEHRVRHTEAAGPYKCSVCSLRFKKRLVLCQHMLAHRRIFTCTICGAKISKWSNCSTHRQKCGGATVLVMCQVCSKVFSDEHSLKVHSRIHGEQQKYTCEHCGAKFTTKQRLTVHIRSHSGVKPFACERCSRQFSTHSNLKAHFSVHSDVSPHYCVECNTHYKTAKSLKRHLNESMRHLRDQNYMYSCKECSKQFLSSKTFQNHVAKHLDTTQLKCVHCDKSFSNKSNLTKHLKCIHRSKHRAISPLQHTTDG